MFNREESSQKLSGVASDNAKHYDENFGTRLIDIASSIYTGLYFACVSWEGCLDEDTDGLLYLFLLGGTGLIASGYYYDHKPDDFDPEFDDVAPKTVDRSFLDWEHPELFRIYKSSSASPRKAAQDGWFLVRGDIEAPPLYGQGFKFRIPACAKERIARQLWLTGYTPERIVRGEKGRKSKKNLGKLLGLN